MSEETRYQIVLLHVARYMLRRRSQVDPVSMSEEWALPPIDCARALDELVRVGIAEVIGDRTVVPGDDRHAAIRGEWRIYREASGMVIYDSVLGAITESAFDTLQTTSGADTVNA